MVSDLIQTAADAIDADAIAAMAAPLVARAGRGAAEPVA